MSLQPIDQQTLFARLGMIGREQAGVQDAIAQNQVVQGNEIARESQKIAETVVESEEVGDGAEGVDDRTDGGARRRTQQMTTGARHDESTDDEAFSDPELGRHVDLSG